MSITLAPRLAAVAQLVPEGAVVADIGGDHGFLLIYLVQQNKIKRGIISEFTAGPYLNALRNVQKYKLEQKIEVRQGDGLQKLAVGEVNVAVLAGMGGALISHILTIGRIKLPPFLIMQPQNAASKVRLWLEANGYQLVVEKLVLERNTCYEILVAKVGQSSQLYPLQGIKRKMLFEIGPILWQEKPPLIQVKLAELLAKKERIVNGLEKTTERNLKKQQLKSEIAWLKEHIVT
ncbi:MAG: hypothetical protein RLZ12_575 [Bacillota bacterium]|jgi:tRNA (adenine22-N1)-methyltransferase